MGPEDGKRIEMGKKRYVRMDLQQHQTAEDDEDDVLRRKSARKYVFFCSVFASLNSVFLGYDVGVMSGAILFIQQDLNLTRVQEETLVGILSVMSLLGSLLGGRTSDAIGRKWTMALAVIVFQTGAAVMTFAPSFHVLMIGRIIAGIGIGFGLMIAPVYIAEISLTVARGSLTSFPEIFINLGILLGYVSNYVFSGLPAHTGWRVMLAVGILPSVFIAVALCVIPESPRWLVLQNRAEEARLVLLKTNEDEAEADERLAEIQLAAAINDHKDKKAVWRELVNPSPALGRMLITGVGIQCFQQITGIDATVYYSPEIFLLLLQHYERSWIFFSSILHKVKLSDSTIIDSKFHFFNQERASFIQRVSATKGSFCQKSWATCSFDKQPNHRMLSY